MSEPGPTPAGAASGEPGRRRFLGLLPLVGLAGLAALRVTGCRREASGTQGNPAPAVVPPVGADRPSASSAVPPATAPVPAWPETRMPLADLPDGQRTTLRLGTFPVEVQRTGRTVHARSLLCTHMGCPVQWRAADARYFCPCHGGLFDADGRPLEGPPPRPLDPVPVTVAGETVTFASASGSR